jgi:Ser/Thr protein kinase RdoA (MazF antagonist)
VSVIAAEIPAAWGWDLGAVEPIAGGLINATFAIRAHGRRVAALQRLHPVFAAEVNLDLEAVTAHIAARGLSTPRLIRTRSGAPWLEHAGQVWRALTWIDGETVHAVPGAEWAEQAAALVGRFHRAVADLVHDYRFVRAGVHDTAAHLARLGERARASSEREASELAREILAAAAGPRLDRPRCRACRCATFTAISRSPT